jgi:periplasmic mercuric ion binding protein
MKKTLLIFAIFLGLAATENLQAQDGPKAKQKASKKAVSEASFEVNGVCGMCRNRVEKAAQSMEGVQSAVWNMDSKTMTVKFSADKTTAMNVQQKIASIGHDTEEVKATEEAYNSLPGCCKYKRN